MDKQEQTKSNHVEVLPYNREWTLQQNVDAINSMLNNANVIAQRASDILRYRTSAYSDDELNVLHKAIEQSQTLTKALRRIQDNYSEQLNLQNKLSQSC